MNNKSSFYKGFATRLKQERITKTNYTQDKLSEVLGFGQKYIARLECNSSFPSLDALIILSNFFSVSIDYLIFGTRTCDNENLQILISQLSENEQNALADVAEFMLAHNHDKEQITE